MYFKMHHKCHLNKGIDTFVSLVMKSILYWAVLYLKNGINSFSISTTKVTFPSKQKSKFHIWFRDFFISWVSQRPHKEEVSDIPLIKLILRFTNL